MQNNLFLGNIGRMRKGEYENKYTVGEVARCSERRSDDLRDLFRPIEERIS